MNQILIMEDEAMAAKPLREVLELSGMEAEVAELGENGLKRVKEKDYDMILLDLKMLGASGEEALREIRKIRPYVFVIVYANFSDAADFKVLINVGIDGYVSKSSDADLKELVATVKEKLEPFTVEDMRAILESAKMGEEQV